MTAILVGHSWGGHLAMHIASAQPARVQGLLLLDALGAVGDGGAGTMESVIRGRIGEAASRAYGALESHEDLDEDERGSRQLALLWPGYFKDPAAAPPAPPLTLHALGASVMTDALRLLDEGALKTALPILDVPSLHLIGRHSPIEPSANQRTAALMQGASVEIQDAGHFAWLEHPGSVAAAFRRLRQSIAQREDRQNG